MKVDSQTKNRPKRWVNATRDYEPNSFQGNIRIRPHEMVIFLELKNLKEWGMAKKRWAIIYKDNGTKLTEFELEEREFRAIPIET